MKLRISDTQYKKIFLNEQVWEHPEESSPNLSLSDAPVWFDVPSAQWVSGPTGGGLYMDKYGSSWGQYISERKKPLSKKEKEEKNKNEKALEKIKRQNFQQHVKSWEEDPKPIDQNFFIHQADKTRIEKPNQVNVISDKEWAEIQKGMPKYTHHKCNSQHIRNCISKVSDVLGYHWEAMDVTKTGKQIDLEKGNYWVNNDGSKQTSGKGLSDNKKYSVCSCELVNSKTGERFTGSFIGPAKQNYGPQLTPRQQELAYERDNRIWYNTRVRISDQEKVHRLLDLLAIGALLLPGGVAISAGIEAVNAGLYMSEGDVTTGVITLIGAFALPAGIGVVRKIGNKEAKQIGKAWVKYGDDIALGNNPTTAFNKQIKNITSTEGKKVFEEMATNPNYIKKHIGTKNINKFNTALRDNPQLGYKMIKEIPDLKKIGGWKGNIKHAYIDEFITPLPMWLRATLTGGIGTLYGFLTNYADKKKDRELVKQLMVRYDVPLKTKDGKSVEDIIVNSPAVKELEKQFNWMAKLYGGDEPVFGSEYHKDKMGNPEEITVQLLEKIQRLVKYVAKLPIEDLTERQLTAILQKHKSDFNNNIEYIISKIKKIIPKLKNMEIIDLIDSEGLGYEKNNQVDIENAKKINLKGDNTYEYAKWGEYWFFRKKGETPWKFMKTEIDKSGLEKSYKDEQNKYDKASEGEIDALLDSLGF